MKKPISLIAAIDENYDNDRVVKTEVDTCKCSVEKDWVRLSRY